MTERSDPVDLRGRAQRMENVDFGKAATDYATHRAGFPERLWDQLSSLGIEFNGARAIDLGTGTGAVDVGTAAVTVGLYHHEYVEAGRIDGALAAGPRSVDTRGRCPAW